MARNTGHRTQSVTFAAREMSGACYRCGASSRYKQYRYCQHCYETVYVALKRPANSEPQFVKRVCRHCDQEFNARACNVKLGKGMFCSKKCSSTHCQQQRREQSR